MPFIVDGRRIGAPTLTVPNHVDIQRSGSGDNRRADRRHLEPIAKVDQEIMSLLLHGYPLSRLNRNSMTARRRGAFRWAVNLL